MVLRKRNTGRSVTELLPEIIEDFGWEKQLDLHSIFPLWRQLVSEELGRYAEPLKIERGVLWLKVESSAWMQQFQYEKLVLLEELNNHLRISRLKDVRMVLPTTAEKMKADEQDGGGDSVSFVTPDEESVRAFEKQIESIDDEKCRESLMRFWYLAHACRRNTA